MRYPQHCKQYIDFVQYLHSNLFNNNFFKHFIKSGVFWSMTYFSDKQN